MPRFPPLDDAVAKTRVAARRALRGRAGETVLVALSGGADSLALVAAATFETRASGAGVGAVIVDHGLQAGSHEVAARAAEQARTLGAHPVVVRRVEISATGSGGPEAAARAARYAALDEVRRETGASVVLTAHTRDDQAEQVLLALSRGSGTRALAAIPPARGAIRRPFLDLDRVTTRAACAAQGLEPWDDPHNRDQRFARVRVRHEVLPLLEERLGPGVAMNLARSAEIAREDAEALDELAHRRFEVLLVMSDDDVMLPVTDLAADAAAIRQRVFRLAARRAFGTSLSRAHTLAIAELITGWHGQGPITVTGGSVRRESESLRFTAR